MTPVTENGVVCNCDLDMRDPDPHTGHTVLCRIHKARTVIGRNTSAWSCRYRIEWCYGQDFDTDPRRFHVFLLANDGSRERLTVRGYASLTWAKRICEMRYKLGLDELDNEARHYLRSHFSNALETLEDV
jgi:hypothetical protein